MDADLCSLERSAGDGDEESARLLSRLRELAPQPSIHVYGIRLVREATAVTVLDPSATTPSWRVLTPKERKARRDAERFGSWLRWARRVAGPPDDEFVSFVLTVPTLSIPSHPPAPTAYTTSLPSFSGPSPWPWYDVRTGSGAPLEYDFARDRFIVPHWVSGVAVRTSGTSDDFAIIAPARG